MQDARSDLTNFLAAFDNLTDVDRAKATEHILRNQRLIREISEPRSDTLSAANSTVSPFADAHSCRICNRFTIKKLTAPSQLSKRLRFGSPGDILTKDALLQGLAQECTLVQWIFGSIDRSLTKFKQDIASKGLGPPSDINDFDNTEPPDETLGYISAEGFWVQIIGHGQLGRSSIRISYDADPAWLDKLWSASHDLHDQMNYESFIRRHRGNINGLLNIFTTADNPAASAVPVRPVTKAKTLDETLQLGRKWLDECQENHDLCCKRDGTLPSRVVDIGTKYPIRSVRLHWSEEGETGRYAALTYCWGESQPVKTSKDTAQDYTDGIVFSSLPKSLQDAMIVTHNLGLRYIWIDCLCIIQDDPDDVAREVSRMGSIFQEAFVALSAASGANVHEGFLSNRTPTGSPSIKMAYESGQDEPGMVLVEQVQRPVSPEEDPINLRAWTLQEHMLARRMIVYSTREIWWTCETGVTYEAGNMKESAVVPVIKNKYRADRFSLHQWRTIVRDYSRRFLTFSGDKLPAIAGIAAEYGKFFNSRYIAGLWEYSLLSELMWASSRADITRPLELRAPSWSWASVDGEINHDWCPLNLGYDAPEILECQVVPVLPSSPYGSIDATRSTLRIAGLMVRVYWQPDKLYIYTLVNMWDTNNGDRVVRKNVGRTQADVIESVPQDGDHTVVWVLPITRNPTRGLLLAHVDGDRYRRVGLVLRLWDDAAVFDQFEKKTITIQ